VICIVFSGRLLRDQEPASEGIPSTAPDLDNGVIPSNSGAGKSPADQAGVPAELDVQESAAIDILAEEGISHDILSRALDEGISSDPCPDIIQACRALDVVLSVEDTQEFRPRNTKQSSGLWGFCGCDHLAGEVLR